MREKDEITDIYNKKGDVWKTLTAVSLGVGLAQMGKRVLLFDVDTSYGHNSTNREL